MKNDLSAILVALALVGGAALIGQGCALDGADTQAASCGSASCGIFGSCSNCSGCGSCSSPGCSSCSSCSSCGSGELPPPHGGGDEGGGGGGGAPACDTLDAQKSVVLYLSADDSNSTASATHVREQIRAGHAPDPTGVRTYEFLNYYHLDYAPPEAGTLGIFPEMQPSTTGLGAFDLQIGVRSWEPPATRRPATITLVLDTSGSMGGSSVEREKAAVRAIAKSLREGDIVSAVTWSTTQQVLLDGHAVSGPDDPALLGVASDLAADGGTDLSAGLVRGYKLATDNYGEARLNRLVLISDGGANVGVTDKDLIAQHSLDADKEGIYLAGVGVGSSSGPGSYNDELMDTVTDKGRGAYVYLDSEQEAQRMFVDRWSETMDVAARSVQVELTLPWYLDISKFYGEAYSTDATAIEPQHLAPGDAMIFDQVLRACSAEQVVDTDTITIRVTWKEPITYAVHTDEITKTIAQIRDGAGPNLAKGKAIVAYAEALKTGTTDAINAAIATVQAANPLGTDADLTEIEALLQQRAALGG